MTAKVTSISTPLQAPMGMSMDRVDGYAKVTGGAQYAADFHTADLTYGWVISSPIAHGRIVSIDAQSALALPGVLLVLSHLNRPKLASYDEAYSDDDAADGSPFRPLYNERIVYSGQPVALVVAKTLEQARMAAAQVQIEYQSEPHQTDLNALRDTAHPAPAELPGPRGDVPAGLARSTAKVEVEYQTPAEHHNPMEPHASTVVAAC